MKKLLILPLMAALSLCFFACSDDDDEGGSSVTPISTKVTVETQEKGAAYSKDCSIELGSNPLTDAAFAALKSGTVDITDYLVQSSVSASSSSSRAAATTTTGDADLEGFKATLKSSSTKYKLEFSITATTPNKDSTVLVTAVIPAEVTEKNKPYVSLVTQVKVGEGAGESDASVSFSGLTIPSATEIDGLVLKSELDEEKDIYTYYKFEKNDDGDIIAKKYRQYSGYSYADLKDTYVYDVKTGEIKEEGDEGDIDSALGVSDHLIKVGSDYYIYDMKLTRSSGKGLDSTFSSSISVSENLTAEDESGKSYSMGTAKYSVEMVMTTTSSLTFTGAGKYSYSYSFSDKYKKVLLAQLEEQKEWIVSQYGQTYYDAMVAEYTKGASGSGTYDMTGVYVNDNGVITAHGKEISAEVHSSGKVETEVSDFENETAFYDGTSLYFGEKYKTGSLPATVYD